MEKELSEKMLELKVKIHRLRVIVDAIANSHFDKMSEDIAAGYAVIEDLVEELDGLIDVADCG